MNGKKIFVVGLDGATFDVIRPMVEAGKLPTFAKIMAEGAYGNLRSTIPPVTPPAWASFMTGKNPGKHGVYSFSAFVNGSYEAQLATGQSIRAKRLWDYFNNDRVALIDIPMSFPPQQINGYMISGWPVPSEESLFTYPPELHTEIMQEVGEYVIDKTFIGRSMKMLQEGNGIEALAYLAKFSQQRKDAALYLLKNKGPFDFFMVVFRGPDFIQHILFKVFDEEYAKRNPTFCKKYQGAIFQFYEKMDRYLAELMEAAGKETTVIVLSDHGAGPVRKRFYINRWLKKEGFLHTRKWMSQRSIKVDRKPLSYFLDRTGFSFLNRSVFSPIRQLHIPYPRRHQQHPSLLVDWDRTSAFAILILTDGIIRINLAGREPAGIVSQANYDKVRAEIIRKLKEVVDPDTGETVIEEVYRREDIYSGPYLNEAPDLIVVPRDYSYDFSPNLDDGILLERPEGLKGTHRMDGIFFAIGRHVKAGTALSNINITDIAPTILYLMGKPVPDDMDGRVINEAFDEEYFKINPPKYYKVNDNISPKADPQELLTEDQETIMNALKGLGYME